MTMRGFKVSSFPICVMLTILLVAPWGWAVEESPVTLSKEEKGSTSQLAKEPTQESSKESGIEAGKDTSKQSVDASGIQTEKEPPILVKQTEKRTDKRVEGEFSKDIAQVELPDSDSISFIKSLMALSFVLGLIFLAAYFYKKISGIKTSGFRSNRVSIDMVGHLALGEKKFLAIIEIQDKHYFIGITPSNINMLSPLELEFPTQNASETSTEGDFENIFKKAKKLLQQQGKK